MLPRRSLFGVLGACGLITMVAACSSEEPICNLAPATTTPLTVDYGKAATLKPVLCEDTSPGDVSYQWSLQSEVVGRSTTHEFLACPRFVGKDTRLQVDISRGQERVRQSWDIHVADTVPEHPDCGATLTARDALRTLQSGDYAGRETGTDFDTAVACLDQVLEAYPCDIDVAFWAAYGHFLTFAEQAPARLATSTLNEDALYQLARDTIGPLAARFQFLSLEVPSDFSVSAGDFELPLMGLPGISIYPGGTWDRSEILTIDGGLQLLAGGAQFLSAYVGSLRALRIAAEELLNAEGVAVNLPALPESFQNRLISDLEADPRFLTLYPGGRGEQRLEEAQPALVEGLRKLRAALIRIKGETEDQRTHIFRYYDCGKDGICPPKYSLDPRGDQGDPLLHDEAGDGKYDPETDVYLDRRGNGRYDPPWSEVGPSPGEDDGVYTPGEPIGTDLFVPALDRIALDIPAWVHDFLAELADNIEGPDALDVSRFAEQSSNELIQLALLAGINIPQIRLSRWFENPRDVRDFLPLWVRSQKVFYVDREEEPYYDWGYDHTPSHLEHTLEETPTHIKGESVPVPRCPHRPASLLELDPSGDLYLPESNPSDGCDNNYDGRHDATDGAGNYIGYGIEGNGMFDFIDEDGTGRHSPGEVSEKFDDVGLWTGGVLIEGTQGNDRWDAMDIAHIWPQGDDIGGRKVDLTRDPRNGTLQDLDRPLIDPVYYFFPDAQFNGVLIFDPPTINADGVPLTDNAELMRLISKMEEVRRDRIRGRF